MLAHTKMHHTNGKGSSFMITVETRDYKKVYNVDAAHISEVENFLQNHAEDEHSPVSWASLAKERIEKYKKAGLVLRGIRYRENISQRELAKRSGVNQNEISKIENGKRAVGEKVAKKLAEALHINYQLLMQDA